MKLFPLAIAFLALSLPSWAQNHELAFTLGGTANDLKSALKVATTSGKALQVNFGHRLWGSDLIAIFGEIHMLANPLRRVSGAPLLTRDFASLYLTPGLRIKLNPKGRLQPWAALGAGYALYEQSTTTLSGARNPAPRHLTRGAFQYGGGLDLPVFRWVSLRAEIRDFYTGLPALNVPAIGGGTHNVIVSGGFVLRLGK